MRIRLHPSNKPNHFLIILNLGIWLTVTTISKIFQTTTGGNLGGSEAESWDFFPFGCYINISIQHVLIFHLVREVEDDVVIFWEYVVMGIYLE